MCYTFDDNCTAHYVHLDYVFTVISLKDSKQLGRKKRKGPGVGLATFCLECVRTSLDTVRATREGKWNMVEQTFLEDQQCLCCVCLYQSGEKAQRDHKRSTVIILGEKNRFRGWCGCPLGQDVLALDGCVWCQTVFVASFIFVLRTGNTKGEWKG